MGRCGLHAGLLCLGTIASMLLLIPVGNVATAKSSDPVLRQIATIVERDFYSPEVLRARDWEGMVASAERDLASASTPDQRTSVFHRLLAGLHTSHTEYFPRSDPRYWDLISIFERGLRSGDSHCTDPSKLPASPIQVREIGVWWRREGDSWFVGGLFDQGPAQRAGLRVGDEVLAADGKPFGPITAFADGPVRAVRLQYRRSRGGTLASTRVTPRLSAPLAVHATATRASARLLERDGARIGYVRLWSGVGDAPSEARSAVRELNTKAPDAFILDLRDGWGGVPPEFISVFDRSVPVLVSNTRGGETFRFDGQIRVPTIVLINEGVRSGKEVLAYAIQKHKLATLLGTATPGAMLPGTAYCLDDGAVLYLAVGTTTIDGEMREGRPVQPDISVPFDTRWSAGEDPQLEAAIAHLSKRPPRGE